MKTENLYSIKYVALQTGLTHHVIRAWERRYGAVNPGRTPKNRRVYSAEDIERLKVLKLLTSRGHKISHVARLKANELQSLVRQVVRTDSQGQRTHSALRHTASAEDLCQACLAAVLDLDQERLERVYDQAAISLTSAALLADVIVPLLY